MKIELRVKPDVPNVNGITFTRSAIEKAIAEFNEKRKNGGADILGEMNSSCKTTDLNEVAFKVTSDIEFEGDKLFVDIEPIMTMPKGNALADLLKENKDNYQLFCTSYGGLRNESDGKTYVDEYTIMNVSVWDLQLADKPKEEKQVDVKSE